MKGKGEHEGVATSIVDLEKMMKEPLTMQEQIGLRTLRPLLRVEHLRQHAAMKQQLKQLGRRARSSIGEDALQKRLASLEKADDGKKPDGLQLALPESGLSGSAAPITPRSGTSSLSSPRGGSSGPSAAGASINKLLGDLVREEKAHLAFLTHFLTEDVPLLLSHSEHVVHKEEAAAFAPLEAIYAASAELVTCWKGHVFSEFTPELLGQLVDFWQQLLPTLAAYATLGSSFTALYGRALVLYHNSAYRSSGKTREQLRESLEKAVCRVCRYQQFVKDLANRCSEPPELASAQASVEAALSRYVDAVFDHQWLSSEEMGLWRVQCELNDPEIRLVAPGRRVVLDSTFTKLSKAGHLVVRRVILFSDVLLVCRVSYFDQLLLKAVVPLDMCVVLPDDLDATSTAIRFMHSENQRRFRFTAISKHVRDRWVDALLRQVVAQTRFQLGGARS